MILVCGIPRSGTTWIGKILSQPDNIFYCHEPDNEHNNLLGYACKQSIPRFPYLTSDSSPNGIYQIFDNVNRGNFLPEYSKRSRAIKKLLGISFEKAEKEILKKDKLLKTVHDDSFRAPVSVRTRTFLAGKLFKLALLFNRVGPENKDILIKSVHCILSLPYIQQYFQPKIVIVLRHPANIVLSHLKIGNPDIERTIFVQEKLVKDHLSPFIHNIRNLDHPLERAGAQAGAFYYIINEQLKNNSNWLVVHHEDFCMDPVAEFQKLFNRLNLEWSDKVSDLISKLNQNGRGYTYKRIAEKQVDKWKRKLSESQIEHIRAGYNIFPAAYYKEFVEDKSKTTVENSHKAQQTP